jgi:DNA-directed RNA polymerase specialized sigma24 family protein
MDKENVVSNDVETVRGIAAVAARQAGLSPDQVDEVRGEVIFRWFQALCQEPICPVRDFNNWAFIVARNYAFRLRAQTNRFKSFEGLEGNERIKNLEVPEVSTFFGGFDVDFEPEQFIKALDHLHMILRTTPIGKTDIDRQIWELHFSFGMKFSQIAREMNLSEAVIHRRWYRLLDSVANDLFEASKKSEFLKVVLPGIFKNVEVFRRSMLTFTNLVARNGFEAIKRTAEFILMND